MYKLLFAFLIVFFTLQPYAITRAEQNHALKAAFIREGNLWIKTEDKEVKATTGGRVTLPRWSPDGRWLAYSQREEIWIYGTEKHKNYHVYHKGGFNYQWAPGRNILAFQDRSILDISRMRASGPGSFENIALGVDAYSWMPGGDGFLVSSAANLLPDGWTNPILYKVQLDSNGTGTDLAKNARRFFVIPHTVKKGEVEVVSIGTSAFKWSPDGRWISFIVTPTASWSMDSDMLCVLSADGKTFKPVDEVLDNERWFQWAPREAFLGYIQGGGRMIFGLKNKKVKVQAFPGPESFTFTPKGYADFDFSWRNDNILAVSRSREGEWEANPAKRPLPALYEINLYNQKQRRLTNPPDASGDFQPVFIRSANRLGWLRSNSVQASVWVSSPDGAGAMQWIANVDPDQEVSWYARKE